MVGPGLSWRQRGASGRAVVRGGTLVDPGTPLRCADIALDGGRIVEVGQRVNGSGRKIDASNAFVLAGLIDAHTHASHLVVPTVWDNMPQEEWMLYNVYLTPPFTPEEVYLAAVVSAGQSLRAGTVALLDHGPSIASERAAEFLEATVTAYVDIGIRAAIAPLIADRYLWEALPEAEIARLGDALAGLVLPPLPDYRTFLERARAFLERWHGKHPQISCLLGPSAPERTSPELLAGLASLGKEFGAGFHLHLFESRVQRLMEGAGSFVELLERLGILGPVTSLAHCVWVTDSEIERIARTRTVVVHNAVSNLRTGTGIAPLRALLAAGVRVALGSDGAVANESLDMFQVMKVTALVHKLSGALGDAPTASSVLDICQDGGAEAVGIGAGGLEPGRRADLIIVEKDGLAEGRAEQVLNELIYGSSGLRVRTVLVGGRCVLDDGEPLLPGWRDLQRRAMTRRAERAALSPPDTAAGLGAGLRALAEAAREQP